MPLLVQQYKTFADNVLNELHDINISEYEGPSLKVLPFRSCVFFVVFDPSFKSGSRNKVENYRGVTMLPAIERLFKAIVIDVLITEFNLVISKYSKGL